MDAALAELRVRIDRLDRALIDIVAERLAVCHEVAEVKRHRGTPVIQPQRVRDVLATRREQAIAAGVDADFAEQLFRVLLTETHRIEVAGQRTDPAPDKSARHDGGASQDVGLDTVASRVDHLVIAVPDAGSAAQVLEQRYGFVIQAEPAGGAHPDVVTVVAGGVTLLLVGPEASPAVARYLQDHGPGVQHVAVEVLNANFARADLVARGATVVTPVLIDDDGHEQFFAADDAAVGVCLGFLSRTGHRVGIGAHHALTMFDATTATADEPAPPTLG